MQKQNEKKLRTGYTTGACAAAASKAAMLILLRKAEIKKVEIPFPDSSRVNFRIHRYGTKNGSAWASVIKDAGDDPDITNGAEIVAEVSAIKMPRTGQNRIPEVSVKGGRGVGIVTKPGLAVSVGESAINPVPRKMITEAVEEAIFEYPVSQVEVTISVPNGEELAKKTLNPRLGIIGGISILGTTGIVKPLSDEAWTATIKASMDVAKAMGRDEIVLSSGRSSERIHQERYQLPEECYVMMGDYVEFSFLEAKRHRLTRIHLCVQWAKMTKIAMQIPQTHVRYGAVDPMNVADFLSELDNRLREVINRKGDYKFNTVREIFMLLRDSLNEKEQANTFSRVCDAAKQYAESITEEIPVKVYLASYEGNIIAESR
jgi:cobalt-precorrin-5B (C1)-methyltransferase